MVEVDEYTLYDAYKYLKDMCEGIRQLIPGMLYDSKHDQDINCANPECGHMYYRHFDWMADDRPGCKYCNCYNFVEKA